VLPFILIPLLSEGQAGEAYKPPNKAVRSFDCRGPLDTLACPHCCHAVDTLVCPHCCYAVPVPLIMPAVTWEPENPPAGWVRHIAVARLSNVTLWIKLVWFYIVATFFGLIQAIIRRIAACPQCILLCYVMLCCLYTCFQCILYYIHVILSICLSCMYNIFIIFTLVLSIY